jgi:carbonic anhydrase
MVTVPLLDVVDRCAAGEGASWSYDDHHGDGPSSWKSSYPNCAGNNQSPVNIQTSSVAYLSFSEITFSNYDKSTGYTATVTNNGHTVQLSIVDGLTATIDGAGFTGPYRLVQFHAHWGDSDTVGSEHTVDSQRYPLEIHFVHYKAAYGNISAALSNKDGLAVLGVFAQVGDRNEAFQKLVDVFGNIKYAGTTTNLTNTFAMNDLLPTNVKNFYRYPGSLTTPGCDESVIWTVLQNPITVSEAQLAALRTLNHNGQGQSDVPLVDNFRPVQPLNTRTVLSSFQVVPAQLSTTTKPKRGEGVSSSRQTGIMQLLQLALAAVVAAALQSSAGVRL